MLEHSLISDRQLRQTIRHEAITLAGNKSLKIYGTLQCTSGKRMKRSNRVFFAAANEAIQQGYRPCGHCMRIAYKKWKDGFIQQSE